MLILVVAFVSVAIAIGAYYYFFVAVETDYYTVNIETVEPEYDDFSDYSEPKIDVSFEKKHFTSDAEGQKVLGEQLSKNKIFYSEKLVEAEASADGGLRSRAEIKALKKLMSTQIVLISVTHNRQFDSKDFIKFIKKHGYTEDKIEKYSDNCKLSVRLYTINPCE